MAADLGAALHDVVFLVDVDNTLIDNDGVVDDLRAHLHAAFGTAAEGYWTHFDDLWRELGYADYLGALQRWRLDLGHDAAAAHRLLSVPGFLLDYPFADRLYPRALDVLAKLSQTGTTVLLSDGDAVFQPRKVQRSGLWHAVQGRVMIFVHKEEMHATIEAAWPARRYVLVDDKERLLDALRRNMGKRLATVFPRQGHHANDPQNAGRYSPPDLAVDRIGDLLGADLRSLIA